MKRLFLKEERVMGFSGSRHGMTGQQLEVVTNLLLLVKPTIIVHGGCCGADEEMDRLARQEGIRRRIYPASNLSRSLQMDFDEAFRQGKFDLAPDAPAPGRNLSIIEDADFMVACPSSSMEPVSLRGQGTWHAVHHTRLQRKALFLVVPTGIRQEERLTVLPFELPQKPAPVRLFLKD